MTRLRRTIWNRDSKVSTTNRQKGFKNKLCERESFEYVRLPKSNLKIEAGKKDEILMDILLVCISTYINVCSVRLKTVLPCFTSFYLCRELLYD